ncbi:MAG: response regulator [Elusimicrobiales bacterium]|nr:response regulator [Elusimicrobiales bacterium]
MKDGLTILIAEDDDGHARLIQERFEDVGVSNPLKRFRDGAEAWEFLTGAGGLTVGEEYLLLLDIRMPGLDGVEVLRRMKADERLKTIPVIMLTTTDDPREVENCYKLGCSSYLTKPVEFKKFAEVVKRLGLFLMVIKVDKFK